MVNVKNLQRCFNETIDMEMRNIVDTVKDRIQNAILTAIDIVVAPKIKLSIRSINASSGRDETSVTVNSERGEHIGITALFHNASESSNVVHKSITNDETRNNIPDEVSELSIPGARFDRQPLTHHLVTGQTARTNQFPELPTGRNLTPSNPPSHKHQNLSTLVSGTTTYQWLNKHRELETQTQTITLIA